MILVFCMLSTKDLKTVRKELFDAATKWYDIGLEVGLECSTLDNIKGMYQDNQDCLREMIKCFLKQVNPKPTWKIVVDALKDKAVNYGQLAEAIECTYCKPSEHDAQDDPVLYGELRSEVDSLRARNDKLESEIKQLQLTAKASLPNNVRVGEPQPGFETNAQAVMTITNMAATYDWIGAGIRLTVPEGALPAEYDEVRLEVKVSICGQYDTGNFKLASPVYWIQPSPDVQFVKPLTVEIQHCAKSESQQLLSFVVTKKRVHEEDGSIELPYKFTKLEDGKFTRLSCYGSIKLQSFSGVAVALPHDALLQLSCHVCSVVEDHSTRLPRSLNVKTWCVISANLSVCRRLFFHHKGTRQYYSVVPIDLEDTQVVVDLPSTGSKLSDAEWTTTVIYGKNINLESSKAFSIFPVGLCQLLSTMIFFKTEYNKDILLAQLSRCTFNLLGATAPNNTISVLPIDDTAPLGTCCYLTMNFLPLSNNAVQIQMRISKSDKYKMVTGTFQDVIVMTALSDCIALKAPEKSGEWEFINTTLAGSTFKIPNEYNKFITLFVLGKAASEKPSAINTTFVFEGMAAPNNTAKVYYDPEISKHLVHKLATDDSEFSRKSERQRMRPTRDPALSIHDPSSTSPFALTTTYFSPNPVTVHSTPHPPSWYHNLAKHEFSRPLQGSAPHFQTKTHPKMKSPTDISKDPKVKFPGESDDTNLEALKPFVDRGLLK